jgi:protein SCO1
MESAEGGKFSSDTLSGKVWIVDFIYTNCPAECPMMSNQMRKLQARLQGFSDVHFVSISVDPERDTPQALDTFAHHFGGPSKRWTFLTGSPAEVHLLAYETFHVGDLIGKMQHSTKFAVVDKRGRIRGYYSSFDAEDQSKLVEDVRGLRKLGA